VGYLRARRSIKIAPGVKINLNKKSASVTVGTKGAHYTASTNGTRTKTAGIPGTGLSYVDRQKPHGTNPAAGGRHAVALRTAPVKARKVSSEIQFGEGGAGKVRSFGKGLCLSIVTFGVYFWFWYYLVNDELKDVGMARKDRKLSDSNPVASVAAVLLGGFVVIPALMSVYNYGQRIKHAQRILDLPESEQINPTVAFVSALFCFLVVPGLYYFAYVTKHQNQTVIAAGRRSSPRRAPASTGPTLNGAEAPQFEETGARAPMPPIAMPDPAFPELETLYAGPLEGHNGDVPRTMADRDQLLRDRPVLWEYRLLACELLIQMHELEPNWHAYLDGRGSGERHELSPLGSIDFFRAQLNRGKEAVGSINRMNDPAHQELALGKPGEAGDPVQIRSLARAVTTPYERLLESVALVRAQEGPPDFNELFELYARWIGDPLQQVRSFVSNMVISFDDIESAVVNHKPGDLPLQVNAELNLTLDRDLAARLTTLLVTIGEKYSR
jgi:hypothetical protein